jgi:hypothetical protein
MAHRRVTRLDRFIGILIFLAILLGMGGLLWVADHNIRAFPFLAILASCGFLWLAGWVAGLSLS